MHSLEAKMLQINFLPEKVSNVLNKLGSLKKQELFNQNQILSLMRCGSNKCNQCTGASLIYSTIACNNSLT